MGRAKKADTTEKRDGRHGQELWGVIFFTAGMLIVISLISYFVNPHTNILGPWLGTRLAAGLVSLFGIIPSFFIPIEILYIAILVFRGLDVPSRRLLFIGLFTLELSVFLAIHNLPVITRENFFPPSGNIVGNLITFLLHYAFGSQRFGPYFLFSIAILLTGAVMFEINIRDAVTVSVRSITAAWQALSQKIRASFAGAVRKKVTDAAVAPQETSIPKNSTPVSKKTETPKSEAAPVPAAEDEKNEAAQTLEEDLAAFRARKNAPVTISSPDLVPEDDNVEEEPETGEDDEPDIEEGAEIDPSLIDSDDDEEFCKVPGMDEEAKKPKKPSKPYVVPKPDILPDPPPAANIVDRLMFEEHSRTLERTLLNFGIEGKVVNISPGPVVTRYEIELAPGVKISKVLNLQDDLSMAVGGKKIRIEAPIPGKAAVGIQLPNNEMQLVYFKSILTSDILRKVKIKLPIIIGRSINGAPYIADVAKMPHLLIAGQTGSGKSVAINSFLCTLLMTKTPEELRLILIDPKKVEMSYYENLPHLMAPVVTESKEAVKALQWGVMEMTRRYRLLAKVHARNIESFNQKIEDKSIKERIISEGDNKKLPFIVIIVDELADLMLTASKDVEGLIQRIAQLARAVGIHLIVATQRPSVDIITGPIKANLTSRIAFRTIQAVDSRTILGHIGAEKLLGRGDMLFLRSGAPDIERYHGSFISEKDVETIVSEIRKQEYDTYKIESFESATAKSNEVVPGVPSTAGNERDEKFEEAARLIVSTGLGSTSLLQRRLKLGFARAGRLMDELHEAGIVGPPEGSKAREVLVTADVLEDMLGT